MKIYAATEAEVFLLPITTSEITKKMTMTTRLTMNGNFMDVCPISEARKTQTNDERKPPTDNVALNIDNAKGIFVG